MYLYHSISRYPHNQPPVNQVKSQLSPSFLVDYHWNQKSRIWRASNMAGWKKNKVLSWKVIYGLRFHTGKFSSTPCLANWQMLTGCGFLEFSARICICKNLTSWQSLWSVLFQFIFDGTLLEIREYWRLVNGIPVQKISQIQSSDSGGLKPNRSIPRKELKNLLKNSSTLT